MTNVKPATDAQIANLKELHAECDPVPCNILHLIARIDADREEIARLTSERNALSGINREFAEKIAALKAEVARPRCNDLLCQCCTGRAR